MPACAVPLYLYLYL